MTPRLTRSFRRRTRASLALATVALSAAALTGAAAAAPGSGEVTLTLKRGAESSLLRKGVKVTYSARAGKTGAAKRAARKGGKGVTQKVSLPVVDVDLPTATLKTGGALSFALKGEKATATDLQLEVGSASTSISGKLGKEQLVLFRAKGAAAVDASSIKLDGGKLSLTGAAADALREALDLEKLSDGKLGSADVDAKVDGTGGRLIDNGGLTPPGALKPSPQPLVDPYAAQCPIAAGADPAFGQAPSSPGPLAAEPALASPQAVVDGLADWGFKTSFRGYVAGTQEPGSAGSISALEGAADNGNGSFRFSGDGEYVRQPTAGNDQLVLDGEGAMLFCKKAHSFHLVIKNPTVIVDGANSRIVADIGLNRAGAWGGFKRAAIASLDLTGLRPTYSADGKTAAWAAVPAKLTADGAAVTGLYPAGTGLDPITVSAPVDSVPDLYAGTCAIGSTAPETASELPEAPLALPSLTGTSLVGGNVRWGTHTPLRNNTLAMNPTAGSLQTFEGATYDTPNTVFEYPESSGTYVEGAPGDPADDRLVLQAKGIALLCKPAHLHRYAFGNPTVVIDGANSRLVIDTDARVKGLIRPSVRSDFATLNMTGITPTVNGKTITWAAIPATLTQNGSEAFNGRYAVGTVLDPITVSATLP
jgi:hypothetical protein